MSLDKEKLLNDGYLSFNLKDIDIDLYNGLKADYGDKNQLLNKIEHLRYDTTFILKGKSDKFVDALKTELNFNSNGESNFDYNLFDDVEKNLNFLNARIKLSNEYDELKKFEKIIDSYEQVTNQKWYSSGVVEPTVLLSNIYKKLIVSLYQSDIITKNKYGLLTGGEVLHSTDISLYTKENFIQQHQDGENKDRLCVCIIYLNEDYQDGFGGELVLGNDFNPNNDFDNFIKIKPIFGQVAILDFVKNNIFHSVSPVLDDNFKRFALISFFYK